MPDYQYSVYNNQPQNRAAVQERLNRMTQAGWHIHTAALNYSELNVLWESSDGPPLEYKYDVYNNQFPDPVQERLDKASADGWHVHTSALNYAEFYVLWERGGSALANRVTAGQKVELPEPVQVQVTGPVEVKPAKAAKATPPTAGDA